MLLLSPLLGLVLLFMSAHVPISREVQSQGVNGAWLRHAWVEEEKTDQEYQELAQHLQDKEITDAFFHVGPMDGDGTIPEERYPMAEVLAAKMHEYYPELRVQAWIGQVEVRGGGPLDVSLPETKSNVIASGQLFLDLGFDGIHYNIEPIYSYDADILEILEKSYELTQKRGAVLSIASDEIEFFPGGERLVRLFAKQAGFWSPKFYSQVSETVDQIAVMTYDTAMPYPWLYSQFVRWQTNLLVGAVADDTVLFIGIPTYEDRKISFNPDAENMTYGLQGVQQSLQHRPQERLKTIGTAIYANWTTEEDEWAVYDEVWLGK